MFRFIRSIVLGALCTLLTTLITAATAQGAGFQPNDVVAVQVNTTTGAVALDEFSPTGMQKSPLNVVSIPSSGNNSLIGNVFRGSNLKLSGDDNYLTLAGQHVVSSTTYGVVARVNVGDGTFDLSTTLANVVGIASSSPIPSSAVTSNGNDIWVSGDFGVGYTTLGSSTVIRVNQAIFRNTVGIFGGQLYTSGDVTSGITPPYLVGTVGNGLPKTPTTVEASLPGIPATSDANTTDFWFRDANTIYLNVLTSGTPNPGIQKWSFNGTTWQYQYNLFNFGFTNLSGWVDPSGNTVLFATSGTSLMRILDGGSQALSKLSGLATAPAGTDFSGVAFISVPEPSSLLLMGLGGMVLAFSIRLRGWRRLRPRIQI